MKIYIVSRTTAADPHMPAIAAYACEENARKYYTDLVHLGYQSADDGRLSPSDVQYEEDTIMDLLPHYEPLEPEVTERTFADLYA
jgi:hypothetical protein